MLVRVLLLELEIIFLHITFVNVFVTDWINSV